MKLKKKVNFFMLILSGIKGRQSGRISDFLCSLQSSKQVSLWKRKKKLRRNVMRVNLLKGTE